MQNFCKWIRHDLNDVDFVWNIVMLAETEGWWLLIMALYYWLFKRRKNNRRHL